jgi:hypothetical protein
MADRRPAHGQLVIQTNRPGRAHCIIALGVGALGGFIAAFGEALYLGVAAASLFVSASLFALAVSVAIAPLVEESTRPLGLFLLKEDQKLRFEPPTWARCLDRLPESALDSLRTLRILLAITVLGLKPPCLPF